MKKRYVYSTGSIRSLILYWIYTGVTQPAITKFLVWLQYCFYTEFTPSDFPDEKWWDAIRLFKIQDNESKEDKYGLHPLTTWVLNYIWKLGRRESIYKQYSFVWCGYLYRTCIVTVQVSYGGSMESESIELIQYVLLWVLYGNSSL